MADFHAADLWVAVVPETSQVGPAMEQAGKEAKGKFGDAVKGIGKNVHDEFDKIGQKAKDAFGKAGKTAGEVFSSEIGKELTNTAGAEIGKALGEAVKDLPGVARGVELFQQWGSASKVAAGGIQSVSDAIHSAKVGDFNGALDGVGKTLKNLEPVAKTFGVDISGWETPLGNVQEKSKSLTDTYGQLKGNIKDTSAGFADLTNNSGRIAGGLNAIAAAAGPLAGTFAALDALMPGFDQHLNNVLGQIQGKQGFNPKDWINTLVPGTNLLDKAFGWDHPKGGSPGAGGSNTSSTPLPGGVEPYPEHFIGPIPPGAVRAPNGVAPPGTGTSSGNAYKSWYGDGASASHSGNWDAVAGPEAGGNWQIDHGEGPDVTGGLQIATQTWLANGGGAFAPKAYMATPEQQKTIGDRILATQGPGAWPVTSKNHPDWFKGGGGGGGGGSVPTPSGLPNVKGAHPQLAYALAAAQSMFPGLQLTAGKDDHPMDQGWHPKGQAIDIGGGTPQQQAQLSNWLLQFAPDIEELIHSGPGVTQNIKSGRVGPAIDMPGSVYNSGQAGYHGDHVHLAIKDEMAQAFESALGGGGLQAAGLNGRGPNGQIPTGAEHDPLYVTAASSGSGGGGSSPFESQGQQLGQGLLGGLMQSVGLDGSVFGGKSPLDFGAVKLGSGLLNYGMGLMNSMSPGRGGGGGLGGLAGLIPGPGAAISAAAAPGGGSLGLRDAVGGGPMMVHHDNSVTVNGPFNAARDGFQEAQFQQNAAQQNPPRSNGYLSNVPVPAS